MKKNILLVAIIFFTTSIFIGCSSDSPSVTESNSSLIIGKWQIINSTKPDDYETCDYQSWTVFKTGGKYDDFDSCSNETSIGTWSVKNNVLTVISEEFPIPFAFTIKSLTNDTLILVVPDLLDGGTEEVTYKKI